MKLHFHNWSRWSVPFAPSNSAETTLQCRTCTECNRIEVKPIIQPWVVCFDLNKLIAAMKESVQ